MKDFLYKTLDNWEHWQGILPNRLKPFVHKFDTNTSKWIYDVNTGRIVRVDAVVWDIIDEYGILTRDEIIEKYTNRHSSVKIGGAYDEITDARENQRLFLAEYPNEDEIVFKKEKSHVERELEGNLKGLSLCVTEACNFRCSYCIYGGRYDDWRRHSEKRLSERHALAAINDFLKHSRYKEIGEPRILTFYGGEPLLELSLIKKCVGHVKEKGQNDISFSLVTNGYLLTEDVGNFLASNRFHIQVSMDGPRQIHDRNRRHCNGSGTYDTIAENVRYFVEKHPEYTSNGRLQIHATLTLSGNAQEVQSFFCSDQFDLCDTKVFVRLNPVALSGFPDKTLPDPSDPSRVPGLDLLHNEYLNFCAEDRVDPRSRAWAIMETLFQNGYLDVHRRAVALKGEQLKGGFLGPQSICIPGWLRLFVDTNGDYYPCEQVPTLNAFKLGSVEKGIDISYAFDLITQFMSLNHHQCVFCWCVRNCRVGCLASVKALTEGEKRKACAKYRRICHDRLIRYCKVLETNPRAFDHLNKGEGRDIIVPIKRSEKDWEPSLTMPP